MSDVSQSQDLNTKRIIWGINALKQIKKEFESLKMRTEDENENNCAMLFVKVGKTDFFSRATLILSRQFQVEKVFKSFSNLLIKKNSSIYEQNIYFLNEKGRFFKVVKPQKLGSVPQTENSLT